MAAQLGLADGWDEGEGRSLLAHGIILSPPTSLCLPGVFRTQMTTLVFLHIPCSSLHSHFKPVIFLHPDELVFTVRQPGCRIHVAVSYFASALVHGMMGDKHHSWSPERALCVSDMYCSGPQCPFPIHSPSFTDFS